MEFPLEQEDTPPKYQGINGKPISNLTHMYLELGKVLLHTTGCFYLCKACQTQWCAWILKGDNV